MDVKTERALAELAVELSGGGVSVEYSIEQIIEFAMQTIGTPYAGLTLVVKGGRLETVAPSNAAVVRADEWQHELREGPCVDAALETPSVVSNDLVNDPRWPRWGPRAGQAGLRSVLSSQLHAAGRRIGALNLYGDAAREFTSEDIETSHIFTQHASAAVASARDSEQLRQALDSRTVIGQAQGILMERYSVDADRAFAILRRYSQDTNVKLSEIARQLTETSALPGVPQAASD